MKASLFRFVSEAAAAGSNELDERRPSWPSNSFVT
jgi:hypothetical protein